MEHIVVEWDREHVLAAIGETNAGRVSLKSISKISRSGDNSEDNTQDGASFTSQLKSFLSPAMAKAPLDVTVLLPRQSVTVHRISLPQVPDAELPAMVRLQAATRLTVPIESVSLDFAPLPVIADSPTRDVLLVTTPAEQIKSIRTALGACNLQLKSVRATSFCIATAAAKAGLLKDQGDPNLVDAIVLLRSDFIEVTFVKGMAVLFSHSGASWGSAENVDKAVRSELTRARMAAAELLGEYRIGRLILIGQPDITSAVSDQISTRVDGAALERCDPAVTFFGSAEVTELGSTGDAKLSAASMVAIAGAMHVTAENKVEGVDLVNPRRPPEKKDLTRVRILGGTLAALLLFAFVWNWQQGRLKALNATMTELQSTSNELTATLKRGEPDLKLANMVSEWTDRDINWLDQLQNLQQLLPATDRFLIKDIKFDIKQGNDLGTIRVDGRARSAADIEQIARRLSEAGYLVQPYTPEQSQRDPGYPYAISMNLVIPIPQSVPATTSQPVPKTAMNAQPTRLTTN